MKKILLLVVVLGLAGCELLPKRSVTKLQKSPCACVAGEGWNV